MSAPASVQRWLDLGAVVGLLAWGARRFPDDVRLLAGRVVSTTDAYLFGPDAAEWAGSALAFHDGRYEDLDFHRMPSFSVLTAGWMELGLPVIQAMHLHNRLTFWVLPVVLYALGARMGSRVAGLGAGITVLGMTKLVETTRAAGVDPTVLFLLPTMLLVASVCARPWWTAPLAGVTTALAAVAHYTTLPFVVPAVLFTLFEGARGWRRWAAATLHLAAAAGVVALLDRVFPFPDRHQLAGVLQEGAQQGTVVGPALSRWDVVTDKLSADLGGAVAEALAVLVPQFRPSFVPGAVLVAALAVGAVGMYGGANRDGAAGWLADLRRRWRPLPGLVLVLCLAPLPVLAMLDAPERYSFNLLPLLVLLCWRGLAGVFAAVDAGATVLLPRWPAGVLGVLVALTVGVLVERERAYELAERPPPADAVVASEIGAALGRHFSPGGGASVPLREAAIAIDRTFCPHSECPRRQDEEELRRCLIVLDSECGGEGAIPYVLLRGPNPALSRPERAWLDAFVAGRWQVVESVRSGAYQADIYAIPREEARALAKGFETPPPDEHSVPPPPVDPGRPPP